MDRTNEVINFFKKYNLYDEEMFKYIFEHTYIIDYRNEDLRFFIGCAYVLNKSNDKISSMRICMPYCIDEKTMLMAVHEIAHGIYGYKNLNKKYKELEVEVLPLILERLFIEEIKSKSLSEYGKFLDSLIDEKSDERYRFALDSRDELMKCDLSDYEQLSKNTMKLARKWKKQNN